MATCFARQVVERKLHLMKLLNAAVGTLKSTHKPAHTPLISMIISIDINAHTYKKKSLMTIKNAKEVQRANTDDQTIPHNRVIVTE